MIRSQTQRREGHPYTILGRQETPYKFRRSTPWYFKLQWRSCSRSSVMSNSDISRWKLTEQTMIRVQINFEQDSQRSNLTSMSHRQKTRSRHSLATEYTWRSRSWRWNSAADQHTGKQYSRIERTNAYQQRSNTEVSTRTRLTTNLKIPIFWETRETIRRAWSSKVIY